MSCPTVGQVSDMAVSNYGDLIQHSTHYIEIATYGSPVLNVSIECLDCCEVLLGFDREGE